MVSRYAAAPLGLAFAGMEVGRVSPSGGQPGHALWAATGSLRALWWVRGIQPNGDLVRGATIDAWRCGGVLEVTLLGKEPAVVAFDVAGGARTSVRIGPNEVRVARVTLPRAQTCRVGMTTTALVGTTRIARQPA